MRIFQGVDIVEISKLKQVILKNEDFVSDIFSEKEIEYCLSKRNPYIHLAGRFAAKEASLKALGIGMSGTGIDKAFKEIEVVTGPSGKPELYFSGWTENISKKKSINQLTVSISHSENYAIATVILTGQDTV
ncbi:MAG: holo-ACP synthase [Nitrospirae bacterium]|nr:holo-ACP synthase [Nitrospirota bacterium]